MKSLDTKLLRTGLDWVSAAEEQFQQAGLTFGHGAVDAHEEALQLVAHVLKQSPENVLDDKHPVGEAESQRIVELMVARIETRKPLAYLTNTAWFMGLPFYVDERVLVPRSPLGEWIERAFSPWIDPDRVTRILDVGTGSGSLAILSAMAFPKARVDAIDIDEDALVVASINIEHYQLADRVRLIQSDGFSALEQGESYDLILSNPPYVSRTEVDRLPKEYRHEPRKALEAADEGLAMAIRLLSEVKEYLMDNGIFVMEVGYNAEALQRRFSSVPFIWLEQEHGGEGLLLLDKHQLSEYF